MNKLIAGALTGAALMTIPLAASALVIDINTYLTGNPAGSDVTVATLTLTQNGNSVDFKFENFVSNLGAIGDDAFISGLLFSYDGSPALDSGSFWNFGGTQLVSAADFGINPPGKDAGYDFYLDLDYPTSDSNLALRFTDGEYSTWTVSAADGVSTVLVSDFAVLVNASGGGDKPASLAMVHIQQVGAGPGGSGALKYVGSEANTPPQENPGTVPEPATLALLGLGMASLAWMRKHKK
ncbi:MAG: hypothetical protein ABS69_10810 [Nitrosomonadales bacterium SCN 54-20]|nr:MAG: hypothetical protein ABS69_10810 [Nitrosomonadales bacterium SCN 54-20]